MTPGDLMDLEVRDPHDPRLKEKDKHGGLVWQVSTCAQCSRRFLCARHGVPVRGWLLGATRGKQQAWNGWFCTKRCVRRWLEAREEELAVDVEVMGW
jgi:hypothetical protein